MKNQTELCSIALLSVLLTSFGIYVDGDKNNLSTLNSIKEFTMMFVLLFIVLSTVYYSAKFLFKKVKLLF